MATYQNERFSNEEIQVDGDRYESCVFVDCELTYSGGALPAFIRCTFRQSNIQLDGAANKTVEYLRTLNTLGLAVGTEKILNAIQNGDVRATRRIQPPPSDYLGTNYGKLGIYAAVSMAIALLLGLALWYGYIYYPENVVLRSDPARPLFPTARLLTMPVLPQELADIYDGLQEGQIEQLNSYSWVDQDEGIVRIPIDEAMNIIAEEGMPTQESEGN